MWMVLLIPPWSLFSTLTLFVKSSLLKLNSISKLCSKVTSIPIQKRSPWCETWNEHHNIWLFNHRTMASDTLRLLNGINQWWMINTYPLRFFLLYILPLISHSFCWLKRRSLFSLGFAFFDIFFALSLIRALPRAPVLREYSFYFRRSRLLGGICCDVFVFKDMAECILKISVVLYFWFRPSMLFLSTDPSSSSPSFSRIHRYKLLARYVLRKWYFDKFHVGCIYTFE